MKKTYTKPYIAVEIFQLDAAIAASCSSQGKESLGHAVDTCDHDSGYFGNACDHDMTDFEGGDENDRICYHGPVPGIADVFMNS